MSSPYSVSFAERMTRMSAKPMLDVQVCDHCNLRCAGCLHFAPLDAIGSTGDIERFRRRSHPMCRHCDNSALTVEPWGRSKLVAEEWLA